MLIDVIKKGKKTPKNGTSERNPKQRLLMELQQTIKNKKQIEIFVEQNLPVSISELKTYNIFFYITVLRTL